MNEFVLELDTTIQNIYTHIHQRCLAKPSDKSTTVYSIYLFDYVWKMIQVKLALMIRLTNWKVQNDQINLKK